MLPGLPLDVSDPQPRFWRTTWDADPFALCSYSFVAAGSTPRDRLMLTAPMYGGRLWLAGEHTSAARPATVHGAYLSGERVARDICLFLDGVICNQRSEKEWSPTDSSTFLESSECGACSSVASSGT